MEGEVVYIGQVLGLGGLGGVFGASDRDPTASDTRMGRLERVGCAEGLGQRGEKRDRGPTTVSRDRKHPTIDRLLLSL